jgi:hypothetical protein
MNPNGITAELRSELEALLGPVRERLADLDKLIEEREAELGELRQARRDAAKIVGVLDPDSVPKKVGRPPKSSLVSHVAPDTLDRVYDWLVAHPEVSGNGGFSAPSLIRDTDFNLVSRATLTNVFAHLHEQGRLRLDHRGMGGAKFFKVVTRA